MSEIDFSDFVKTHKPSFDINDLHKIQHQEEKLLFHQSVFYLKIHKQPSGYDLLMNIHTLD